jgi:factor associated with neutral sphingomyelinase activation
MQYKWRLLLNYIKSKSLISSCYDLCLFFVCDLFFFSLLYHFLCYLLFIYDCFFFFEFSFFSIIEDFCLSLDGSVLYSVSQDSSLKIYNFSEKKQVRSTNICDLALSSCELSPNGKVVIVGSWDNNIYTYSIEYGSVLETVSAHDDAVSCLFLQGNILASGSWDATVKLWDFRTGNNSISKMPFAVFIDHETAVHSVTLDSKSNFCASGTADGSVSIFDVKTKIMTRSMQIHTASVSCLQFMPDSQRLLSSSLDGCFKMTEINTGVEIFVTNIGVELQ